MSVLVRMESLVLITSYSCAEYALWRIDASTLTRSLIERPCHGTLHTQESPRHYCQLERATSTLLADKGRAQAHSEQENLPAVHSQKRSDGPHRVSGGPTGCS